jgi:methyltransferase (TIGR00027 family)
MRVNLPSRTATIVSAARHLSGEGVSPIGGDVDGLAPLLSPPHAAGWLSRIARMTRSSPVAAKLVRAASGGLVDHAGLRTRYIDGVALRAAAAGVRQMVVVGAGLDARAYRLEALLHLPLFEVDHPATQGWKRQASTRLHRAGGVRHVAVDFLVDRLSDRLIAEGFDAAHPTLWVWEGVTPYLTAAARQSTLAEIVGLSAPGSWLVESYMLPELASIPAALLPLVRAAFGGLGEPLVGGVTTDEIHRELSEAGWSVKDDAGTMEWVQSFAGGDGPSVALLERVVVCSR